MNKSGKAKAKDILIGTGAILVIALVLLIGWKVSTPQTSIGGGGVSTPLTASEQATALSGCGATAVATTLTYTVKNPLNTSATETFDTGYYVYDVMADGSLVYKSTGTDSTAGSVSLDCGKKYVIKHVTDGSADNSRITKISSGATLRADGTIEFVTDGLTKSITTEISKHAITSVKAYDFGTRANMFDSSDASATDYETDGVTFQSSTNNATALSVGAGADMKVEYTLKNSDTVADFNDYGVLVGFDALNTYWDKVNSVYFDGVELQEMKASLNAEETIAMSGYEFVYLIPADKKMDNQDHTLTFSVRTVSDASSTNTLQIDLIPRGNYLGVSGTGYDVKTGAYKDSSGKPVTYAVFDTNIAVTIA